MQGRCLGFTQIYIREFCAKTKQSLCVVKTLHLIHTYEQKHPTDRKTLGKTIKPDHRALQVSNSRYGHNQ